MQTRNGHFITLVGLYNTALHHWCKYYSGTGDTRNHTLAIEYTAYISQMLTARA